MAILAKTVFVRDPERHRDVMLAAGEEPEPRLAALVTNPEAWEDGKLPSAAKKEAAKESAQSDDTDSTGDEDAKPAAKKAAARPARGRKSAADEGSSS